MSNTDTAAKDGQWMCALINRWDHTLHGFEPMIESMDWTLDAEGRLALQYRFVPATARVIIGAVQPVYDSNSRARVNLDSLLDLVRQRTGVRSLEVFQPLAGPRVLLIGARDRSAIARVIDAVLEHPVTLQLRTRLSPVVYTQSMRYSIEQSEALYLRWAMPLLDIPQMHHAFFDSTAAAALTLHSPVKELLRDERLWKSEQGKQFARTLRAGVTHQQPTSTPDDDNNNMSPLLSVAVYGPALDWPPSTPGGSA